MKCFIQITLVLSYTEELLGLYKFLKWISFKQTSQFVQQHKTSFGYRLQALTATDSLIEQFFPHVWPDCIKNHVNRTRPISLSLVSMTTMVELCSHSILQ